MNFFQVSKTKEYGAWASAKNRCINPKNKSFASYGGRGIYMDPRWIESPMKFLRDMGPCPAGYSLDRIDNDGPYSPENCRWATQSEQSKNTRKPGCKPILAFGELKPLREWCIQFSIGYYTVKYRIQNGLTLEEALTRPTKVSSTTGTL